MLRIRKLETKKNEEIVSHTIKREKKTSNQIEFWSSKIEKDSKDLSI